MGIKALTPEDGEGFFATIAPYKDMLDEVLSYADSRQDPPPFRPAADSPAMAEVAEEAGFIHDGDPVPVTGTFSKVALLMLAAEDHLDSLNDLYRPPAVVSVFTPDVVLRAALETLGRAHWLVEPTIGVRRRVGRNLNETLYQHHHRRQLLKGDERKEYDRAFDRESLLAWARSKGYDVTRGADKCWSMGEGRLSSNKVIGRLFSGGTREPVPGNIFRSTSAVTHGSLHGILARVELRAGSGVFGSANEAKVGISADDVRQTLSIGIHAYVSVSLARRRYMGWTTPGWDDTVERADHLLAEAFEVAL